MAFGVNTISILGNLTRDPELRFTPNGTPVASFGIAVNRRVQDRKTGEWVNDVDFFNVIAWFKLAENCAESLSKGDRVLVTGRLSQRSWEDKDGQKKSVVEIIASVVAPSLEFASCKIERNPRISPDELQKSAEFDEELEISDEDIPF
ncbi:MAG: single-stranded DNA-binding protein [Actinobacteria bacterium]|nr:single-stranded DNA-binding protein [Actinomycetota bacterium]